MKRFHTLLPLLLLLCCVLQLPAAKLPSDELRNLRKTIEDAKYYQGLRQHTIDSLLKVVAKVPETNVTSRCLLYIDIGNAYRTFKSDSSLHYYTLAERVAEASPDSLLRRHAEIGMLSGLAAAGIFTQAEKLLAELSARKMPVRLRLKLWTAARQLYGNMWTYVGNDNAFAPQYERKYLEFDDSLLNNLPHSDPEYQFLYAERLVKEGRYGNARKILERLMEESPQESNIYGKAAYQLATVYFNQDNDFLYATYLARAAISDIKGCVNDGWALPTLAKWLYDNGEINEAFMFVNNALADAMLGNARNRTAVIARLLPVIDEGYRQSLSKTNTQLIIYFCLVTFLFLISGLLLAVLFKQLKRYKRIQTKLADTSRRQESYIGTFVGLCSTYSTKLESWQKMVARKLTSGQTDDLLKTIRSGRLNDENDDFHSIIDNAFLELYPDFVEQVNELLREEERITIRKPGVLPPEIRIYALLRLGVEESTRISSILQYSANTVYTYRNKMRNKAINRDTFEDDVRRIGVDI